jgi:uncharacterized membrane protein YjfL (UPF0719 family)
MNETVLTLLLDLGYVVLAVVILLLAKLTLDLLTPYKVDDQLSSKDNPAFGLSLIGYYLGVFVVTIGATHGESASAAAAGDGVSTYLRELGIDAAWALGGILALNLSRLLLDKIVLRSFSTRKEIIDDKNIGMGAVEFGVYISSALVIAGAISGEGGGVATALAFYGLAQVSLFVWVVLYQFLTPYDVHAELEKDNVAAGIALGGNMIAMGLLLMRGCAGNFVSWGENLETFGYYALAAFVLLGLGRYVIDGLFLPGRTLKEEIAEDRNLNAGYLEGGLLVGLAAVIFFTV